MIDEQAEATDQIKAEQDRHLKAIDANRENAESVTAVNLSLVKYHEARAVLRQSFAVGVRIGAMMLLAWSIYLMVRWA